MGTTTLAVLQCELGRDTKRANVDEVERLVREAASAGAQIIVPPELFEGPYFCQEEQEALFDLAHPTEGHPTIARFVTLSRELDVAIAVSFFERAGQSHYNSLVMLDGGENLGLYRKSHIPDGPGYEEKFYFRPGNTGFRVFETRFGSVGAGICWDQWFPEAARAMVLAGAEFLIYPTAIGSEPEAPEQDTREPWQRAMIGHAVANVVPVAAANRVGVESVVGSEICFYGSSFIANGRGDKVAEMSDEETGFVLASFDRGALRRERAGWGFFRDRRPELYKRLSDSQGDLG